ncbi:hypothetical protein [Streptomyces sp. NPDC048623]|uniref:hypothetical protein n=1 Tax=Streptomyces sp. NPDC048623 TaxID=3155761 RepID=UPI00343C3708
MTPTTPDLARDLTDDLTAGHWTPTALDRRVAELLATASAGDGHLTPERLRSALWEGAEPFLRQPDNRFATLLAQLTTTPPAPHDPTLHTLLHHLTPHPCPAGPPYAAPTTRYTDGGEPTVPTADSPPSPS